MTGIQLVLVVITILQPVFSKNAFIIVDVQNCFVPGGTLPVSGGNKVVEPINKILKRVKFDLVVRSQDWHCPNHVSFASQHKNKSPFSSIDLKYTASGKLCDTGKYNESKINCEDKEVKYKLSQTLWPDHCVIDSKDADFHKGVNYPKDVVTVRKGYHCQVDSYSAFFDNGGFTSTELDDLLKKHNITHVYSAGLATDYCVSATAKDAKQLGYLSCVVEDASAYIAMSSLNKEKEEWKTLGVHSISTRQLIKRLNKRPRRCRGDSSKCKPKKRCRGDPSKCKPKKRCRGNSSKCKPKKRCRGDSSKCKPKKRCRGDPLKCKTKKRCRGNPSKCKKKTYDD